MNFFVEGLQGSGKSTLVSKLSEKYPHFKAIREGDYSPVELSWCGRLTRDQYDAVLEKYPGLRPAIREKSFPEGDHVIVCYTQVQTENRAFYQDLEQYEIYNGRVSKEAFRQIILTRFSNWNGQNMIFECSLFQNIVEDMMLFQVASDAEIIDFYREIAHVLSGKDYHIFYLESDCIGENIAAIRKERTDEQGREVWFSMMCGYFNESPYAVKNHLSGESDLLEHFRHRQALEVQLCREVFSGRFSVLKSKEYKDEELGRRG